MNIFLLLFSFFLLNPAQAKERICKMSEVRAVEAEARKLPITDKNMHCSTSCILTLKCYSTDVFAIGIAKEIMDLFTPGDYDINDIRANLKGIRFATSGTARDKRDCYERCLHYYPNP